MNLRLLILLPLALFVAGADVSPVPHPDPAFDGDAKADLLKNGQTSLKAGGFFVAFSPDGARLLTDGQASQLWDSKTWEPGGPPLKHRGSTVSADFRADGKVVIVTVEGRIARLLDAATGGEVTPALRHSGAINTAAFSADGRKILTIGDDTTATVWDAQTGRQLSKVKTDAWMSVFSPDGLMIVTTPDSSDEAACVWDAAMGKPVTPALKRYPHALVNAAAFSPDGKRVVTAEDGSKIHVALVWDGKTHALLTTADLGERAHGDDEVARRLYSKRIETGDADDRRSRRCLGRRHRQTK